MILLVDAGHSAEILALGKDQEVVSTGLPPLTL